MNYLILFLFFSSICLGQEKCNNFDEGMKLATQKELKESDSVKNLILNNHHMGPIKDQGDIGYCYAYSAADLLDHHLKKNKKLNKNESISSMGIAFRDQMDVWKKSSHNLMYEGDKRTYNRNSIDKYSKIREAKAKEAAQNVFNFFNTLRKKKNFSSLSSTIVEDTNSLIKSVKPLSKEFNEKREHEKRWVSESLIEPGTIPDGGFTHAAIKKLSKAPICLESEFGSRDEGLIKLFQERNLMDSVLLTANGNGFLEAIGQLALVPHELGRSENQSEMCLALNIIADIFPQTEINTLNKLTLFIKGGEIKGKNGKKTIYKPKKSTDEFFAGLIEEHCKNKSVSMDDIPEMENLVSFRNQDKSVLTDKIDSVLKRGDIAEISYDASILTSNSDDNDLEMHSSVITGSLSICDEPYYILRNSWGKHSCSYHFSSFSNSDIPESINKEYFDCIRDNYVKVEKPKKAEEKEALHSKVIKECKEDRKRKLSEVHKPPYFCDEEGNYIIRKDYLKKDLWSVTNVKE